MKVSKILKKAAINSDAEKIVLHDIVAVKQKLDALDEKLQKLKYNPDEDPQTEALHTLIVCLSNTCLYLKSGMYEAIGQEMKSTGSYILRNLV